MKTPDAELAAMLEHPRMQSASANDRFNVAEHMPWMNAERNLYDQGFNAGIAAAVALLHKSADNMTPAPGNDLERIVFKLTADSVRIGAENVQKLLRGAQ